MIFDQFNNILKKWADEVSELDSSVVAIIQFGSTCKIPLKKETDVDLLYIVNVERKMTPFEIYEYTKKFDDELEKRLKQILHHNLVVSSHLKNMSQLDHLSPMYLDFSTDSRILFEKEGVASQLLENIKNWITLNNAKRVNKGSLWYWIYDDKDPKIPVDFRFIKK